MHLVHSTHTWLPLSEQWIYRQVKHIHGFQQRVLCDARDTAHDEIVPVFYNPSSQASIYNRVRRKLGLPDAFRAKHMRSLSDAILFSHYGMQGYHDIGLKKQKHITRFYGYDLNRVVQADARWRTWYKELFHACDAFITEGPYMKSMLVNEGCNPEKVQVSYLGVETDAIPFTPRTASETLHVLIACATAERKGIIYSLQALNILVEQYRIPVQIHWVGGRNASYPQYIQYENLLEDFLKQSSLLPFITRYGWLPNEKLLSDVASRCQVCIHPSVWAADGDCEGGYPVVLADVMASGVPVISTTHCDIPEIVTPENGYLCREKNVDDLVSALLDCYTGKTYIEKSVASRNTIEQKFDWKKLGTGLSEIIRM